MEALVVPWVWPDSTVVRVIDGDSFTARLHKETDIGFHGEQTVTFEQKLRLNRINAAPIGTEQGKAAKAFTEGCLFGKTVTIVTVGPYKYGDEWMAEVTLPSKENLSDLLVAQGLAAYWSGKGPRPLG